MAATEKDWIREFNRMHRRAIGAEISRDYSRSAVRPLAALELPEDAAEWPEDIAAAIKAFPDDMQIEDNDLPLTYGDVRMARESHNPLGAHPDVWDRHKAMAAQEAAARAACLQAPEKAA